MIKTFEDYTLDWFHDWLSDHEDIEGLDVILFNMSTPLKEGETMADYLQDETTMDYLMSLEADDIYHMFFGFDCTKSKYDNIPDLPITEEFLEGMFKQAQPEEDYDFFNEFIEDMANECTDYSIPSRFFEELGEHGCISGMISSLIFNDDCLQLYGKYADSLEGYKEDIEANLGCTLQEKAIHYVWICWLCYEELAYHIASMLWPDKF